MYTVEPRLKECPIGHTIVAYQDGWCLLTDSIALKCRIFCLNLCGTSEQVVSQERFDCTTLLHKHENVAYNQKDLITANIGLCSTSKQFSNVSQSLCAKDRKCCCRLANCFDPGFRYWSSHGTANCILKFCIQLLIFTLFECRLDGVLHANLLKVWSQADVDLIIILIACRVINRLMVWLAEGFKHDSLHCLFLMMNFFQETDVSNTSLRKRHFASLLLEPRSLIVVQDDMYSNYLHGIEERDCDTITGNVANLDQCHGVDIGDVLQRMTRVSVTIRNVPKVLKTKLFLGKK